MAKAEHVTEHWLTLQENTAIRTPQMTICKAAAPTWFFDSFVYKHYSIVFYGWWLLASSCWLVLWPNPAIMATGEMAVQSRPRTVYPKKYAHGFCFAVLCCGYTLTDFPISIRLTSLALWQSNDCPSASKATLMNMDKYFMWSHYERLHNHNKAKHNKTVCIFLGIYCMLADVDV